MNIKLILLAVASVLPFALTSCEPGPYYGANYSPGYYGGSNAYLSVLPYGYRTVHVSGRTYYYHNKSWYLRRNGRYYRTSRPSGYRGSIGRSYNSGYITRLPSGYRSHTIGGVRYYNHGGKWYKRNNGRYYSVSKPSSYRPKPSNYNSSSVRHSTRPFAVRNKNESNTQSSRFRKSSTDKKIKTSTSRINSRELSSDRNRKDTRKKDEDKKKQNRVR